MKFFNLMDKGRWPRGPWNQEPDMVLFQVRRRGLTYTCEIKRARESLFAILCQTFAKHFLKLGWQVDTGIGK